MLHAEVRKGIYDRIHESSRRSNVWRFPHALGPKRVMRGWRTSAACFPVRRFHCSGDQIVHKTAALDVSVFVIINQLHKGDGQTFREPAVDLPLYDHRIDYIAAVVDGHKTTDLDLSRSFVDVDRADVRPERKSEVRRIVIIDSFQPRFEASGNIGVSSESDFLDGFGLTGRTFHEELAGFPLEIFLAALQ